jgi:hypothetical protein
VKNIQALGSVGNKPIERINALTLTHSSQEYLDYYKRGKPNKKPDISKVSYFLLLRSLELALKALMKVKEGISSDELKNKYKHNICKLYTYCEKQNYITPFNKETKIALDQLNFYYQDKDFEYTKIGYKYLPDMSYIYCAIENVHNELNAIFRTPGITKYI